MAFSFDETPDSRPTNLEQKSQTRIWKAKGEQDESVVAFYARSLAPVSITSLIGILWRQEIQIDPAGWNQYLVRVTYGPKKKENGSYSWSFDTTGATIKIKAAKEHIASYPADGEGGDNPHKGAIGVKQDRSVEGADIIIPALKLNVQFRHPQGVITIPQAKALARATGRVSSAAFLDGHFAAGELLFAGATGSDGSETEAEVGYQFIAQENVNDLSIGEITSIVKKGHHYAWVEFEDEVAEGAAAIQPKRVHIERVYEEINFADVLGWS